MNLTSDSRRSRLVSGAAFAIGLAAVAWVGAGFAGVSWPALAMTAVIAAVYLAGAWELHQFRAANTGLAAALADLAQPPAALRDWLERVPAPLRERVRLRVEGERAELPGPALTPYLAGLLVMLGMLGTFLGMVVTFKGAVFAMQGSTDLQAIRAALAEPIRGLGLAFGCSVAGVAASAMLGLMAAMVRRERLELARRLDARIATVLRPFSLAHQRQETFRALQEQSRALPGVVERLDALMARLEDRARTLDAQLAERQQQFHREAAQAYTELARSVGASLKDSLAASGAAAGEAIRPVVAGAMAQVVQETQRTQERLGTVAQRQLDQLAQQAAAAERERLAAWTASLQSTAAALEAQWRAVGEHTAAQQDALRAALEDTQALVRARTESEAAFVAEHGRRMDQLAGVWRTELGALQSGVASHLAALGAALEAPITRLLQTAAEVPQAAAGVIAQLREEMQRVAERDNLALAERTQLLEQLRSLLQAVGTAADEQRAGTQALVASASSVLDRIGAQFTQALQVQAGQAADVAAHVTASAVELSSLAEAFGGSVQAFQAGNDALTATLQRLEASLERSTARSDEQLAYYVAQAREVIDLSIASQHGLIEGLRQLQARPAKAAPATPAAAAAEARA